MPVPRLTSHEPPRVVVVLIWLHHRTIGMQCCTTAELERCLPDSSPLKPQLAASQTPGLDLQRPITHDFALPPCNGPRLALQPQASQAPSALVSRPFSLPSIHLSLSHNRKQNVAHTTHAHRSLDLLEIGSSHFDLHSRLPLVAHLTVVCHPACDWDPCLISSLPAPRFAH